MSELTKPAKSAASEWISIIQICLYVFSATTLLLAFLLIISSSSLIFPHLSAQERSDINVEAFHATVAGLLALIPANTTHKA